MYLYKYYFDSLKMFLMSQSWMWVVTINQQVNIHKLACLIRTNTDKVFVYLLSKSLHSTSLM